MQDTGQLVAHAVYLYLSDSIHNDPPSVIGIDNVLLLLLAEVRAALQAGATADNAAGFDATLSVCRQIKTQSRARGTRRWLLNNRFMLIHIAESMAYAISYPDRELELIPTRPFVGYPLDHRLETPSCDNSIREWGIEYIEEPLPDWYIARLLRPPFRISLLIDKLAYRCLAPVLS